ncbi:hypothetical protein [Novosphingobium sp. M1R2S20]|uniref:Secreted protein n=1 Tax=Novosphingobium rhizovicinum TaxID=3228928 RepID=A0ABV3RDW0_9SPHN
MEPVTREQLGNELALRKAGSALGGNIYPPRASADLIVVLWSVTMRKFLSCGAVALALATLPSNAIAQGAASSGGMQPPENSTSPMPRPAPFPPGTTTPAPAPDGTTTVTTTETMEMPTSSSSWNSGDARSTTMTVQQRTVYDTWPSDRRSGYDTLPIDQQTYFWTLTPEQQEGFWALTPDQRGRLYQMSPEQRALAWRSIVHQLQGRTPSVPAGQANPPGMGVPTTGVPNPQTANQAARPAMPADESYEGGPYKGALTPPPADAMDKEYPVCSRTVQDSCRNPDRR